MKRAFLFFLLWCASAQASVVCIHGFLVSNTAMLPVKRCLARAGFDVCIFTYESREDTIQCHGVRLKEMLKCMARNRPGEPINFVSHSIGGLVVRAAVALPDCPPEAKMGRAVLLAPPNQGSMLARMTRNILPIRIGLGDKSGWQLMYYEPCDWAQIGEFPPSMPVLVIAGARGMHPWFNGIPNDGYVAIEETRLNTPHYFITLDLKHGALLTSGESLRLTRDFLLCGAIPGCNLGCPYQ